MEEKYSQKSSNRQRSEWMRYGLYTLGAAGVLLMLVVLFDYVVMPWYVGLNNSVRVPNVVNKTQAEATAAIEARGLYVQVSGQYFHNSIPAGRVISQLPYSNAEVKEGRRIYLAISKGQETLRMPALRGMTLREARIMLMKSGLELDEVEYAYNDSVRANLIAQQSIQAEEPVSTGQKINVVVSLGPEMMYVIMPDLVGMPLETAEQTLMSKGLVLGALTTAKNETFLPNTVVNQLPAAGDSVATGTRIDLTVAR